MDDRIRRALDGELPRDQLTPGEMARLSAIEAEISAVLRAVPTRPLPDLGAAVLRRIEEAEAQRGGAPAGAPAGVLAGASASMAAGEAAHGSPAPAAPTASGSTFSPGSLFDWVWKPRPVSIRWRPAYGLAAAAVLALAMLVGRESPAAPHAQQVLTHFVLEAPDARQVALAGDFTDWAPAHALTRTAPGVWTVVVPLDPGIHTYAFIVDGERWVPDPNAPAVDDGFGGLNSRLAVLAPDAAEL